MTGRSPPAPVLRFLRRPLWWAAGVAIFVLVQFGAHAREVVADSTTFAETTVVSADVSPVDQDNGVIDLTYRPAPDADVVHAAVVARTFVGRSEVGRVDVEVARADPHAVRLIGEERGYFDEMPYLVVLLVVPLVSYFLRRRHARRMDALVAAPTVSYAMLATAVAPNRLHPRWRLCLYPVDARAGALPVCAVELVWLPVLPPGAFPVEVKGDPRPFGSIAVRAEHEVLWPRGRGLAVTTKAPRPAVVGDFAHAMPIDAFAAPVRPSLWPARALRIVGLVALAMYLWVGSGTQWRDEQALRRSRPATATVKSIDDATPSSASITVVYDHDGTPQTATVHPQSTVPALGAQLPIRFAIDDPAQAWESRLAGPPDANSDIALLLIFGGIGAAFSLGAIVRRQALERLGAHELATTGRVDMGTLPRADVIAT